MSNTRTIARNTGWYGLETVISFVVGLFSSIAVARTLGPSKMGYIIYVVWIAWVVSSLGGMGIPATTRKYMAEFLGMGDRGTARFIFVRTFLMQSVLGALATGGLLFWVIRDANADYRWGAVLVVLSIWPSMVNFIPAQANVATEKLSANLPASIISILVYFVAIGVTVLMHWGVTGIGGSMFLMRIVDLLVRAIPTMNRILRWETTHVQPPGLSKRMITFAWQSVTSMIVALIVWDRSEFFLLKRLNADIRQVAYYSVAFSLAERLLISSAVFGSATGATIFAQFGRDKSRLPDLVSAAFRYLALTTIPLHFIATALAFPALVFLYGNQYAGAAMVVTLAPILCMPKAFIGPVQSLLESNERQRYVIVATVIAGFVDISVAWYLIPAHGAVGACIGSGAAQLTAVATLWAIGINRFKLKLPWLQTGKIVLASSVAALVAHLLAVRLAPLWAILLGGTASLVVLFGLFFALRIIEPEDSERLSILIGMLPAGVATPVSRLLSILMGNARKPQVRFGVKPVSALRTGSFQALQIPPVSIPAAISQEQIAAKATVRISVVIPAYNAAAFLPRCLQSVYAQTLQPDEIIVVDDGSTDNTAALAAQLGARVVSRRNGGLSAARNTGIQAARNEWIALLDADDLWAPEKLERQVACIRPDVALVYTGVRVIDQTGVRGERQAVDALSARKMLRYRNPITPSSVLLRRATVLEIGGFREDIRACEDWEMWVRLLPMCQFECVAEPLTDYYVYPGSLSANPERMLRALDRIIENTLLSGKSHLSRWAERQRILAAQLCSAGLIARDNGLNGEIRYFVRSIFAWPSPLWESRRFSILASSVFKGPRQRKRARLNAVPLVVIVAYHFPPDNAIGGARPYRFYKYLKRLGYECRVFTAAMQTADAPEDIEYVPDPLRTNPGRGIAWHLERIVRRFLLHYGLTLGWSYCAFWAARAFLSKRKNDQAVILSSAPPAGTHLAGMCLAALAGKPWIADFRDPVNAVSGGRAYLQGAFAPWLSHVILNRANHALANTDGMNQMWNDTFPDLTGKTQVLWNGFDPEDTIETYALPDRQTKILSHVGELYGGRDIRPIVGALHRLIESGKVSNTSIVIRQIGIAQPGELPDQKTLRAAQTGGWLEIKDPVPAAEARAMALESDGLLLIQPQTAVQVPAKLFEYLRTGRPILAYVLRDSPAERILQRAGVPFVCIYPEHGPEEMERLLLSFIATLDGRPVSPNQWFMDNFDASRHVEVLDVLIRELVNGRTAPLQPLEHPLPAGVPTAER
jgi:glycosyltransferase involved in cell wall biosynthesis/O-antigen/teichoic acid export membrane protein